MRSNSQNKDKPVPSNKPSKQPEYKPYNLRSKEETTKFNFAYNTPPRKYEEKIENPLKYANYVEPMQMKKFERKPTVPRSAKKEVPKQPKKEQAPYKSNLPFEIVLPTFGKKQTVYITMKIQDKKTDEIMHKIIFKTQEQLELFQLLETERVLGRGDQKQFSMSVPNQIIDEKTLDILIKILTLCEYNIPKMPKVTDIPFRDMLSDVKIYDLLVSLDNTDTKKLYDAACYLQMKSMKTLVCTKMACSVNVLKNEMMVKGQWKNMMSLKPFKQQAKSLGVEKEFTFANFQELKEDNDDARIICD